MSSEELLKQGAEAKLFISSFHGHPVVVKERFQKKYRHPTLDLSLTKSRMRAEVRAVIRARAAGIKTPTIYAVDFTHRRIVMECVEPAVSVRERIDQLLKLPFDESGGKGDCSAKIRLSTLARTIGEIVARLHGQNIIHGDLTTSNMLLKGGETSDSFYLIDFGLSSVSSDAEDKAVDLYVLERALLSTHPEMADIFENVIEYYKRFGAEKYSADIVNETCKKLDDVRMRGRKRVMIG